MRRLHLPRLGSHLRASLPSQHRWKSAPAIQTFDTFEQDPKTWIIVEMTRDTPGALNRILGIFEQFGVNLCHIESRLKSFTWAGPSFHIDFEGNAEDKKVHNLMKEVRNVSGVEDCVVMPAREVPWFPTHISDLDLTRDTLDGGTDLINKDHPGFNDPEYKARRGAIIGNAHTYMHGQEIPRVEYSQAEVECWEAVYSRLQVLQKQYACDEFNECMPRLEKYAGYAPNNIPQLQDISNYLSQVTGFRLRPVAGLLSARDFLNALAFRVFFSTQYIRHHGNPYYTPEPDICHELLGHVPLFANREFADFSQQIGLASLAATDEDIVRLAAVYWFTVEFGLLKQDDQVKAYGAGVLSSFGELEWSCNPSPSDTCKEMGSVSHLEKPVLKGFDPAEAAHTAYPITTYQPLYFVADSFQDAKTKMDMFCDSLHRPFFPQYDPITSGIRVTKSIVRAPRVNTVALQAEKQKAFFDGE